MNRYTVVLSLEFKKEFYKLSKQIQKIAKAQLKKLETNPKKGIRLKHELFEFYSLHFFRNKYRIIYTIEEDVVRVLAVHIGKRTKDFYKKLLDNLRKHGAI